MEELFDKLIKIVAGDVGSLMTTIILGIFTVISGLIFNYLKKWFKTSVIAKWKNRKYYHSIENVNLINNLLIELRVRTDSDRCMIFQFHNGTKYLNENLHTLSFTCLHESVETGFIPLADKFYEVKISHHFDLISAIDKNDILIYDHNTRKDLKQFEYLSYNYGIYSFVAKLLKEKNGGIVGFLLITWNDEKVIVGETQMEIINQITTNLKYNF